MNGKYVYPIRLFCLIFILCLNVSLLWGQTKTVTGQVSDAQGESVIGASILVLDTGSGTITDLDGNFTLNNVSAKSKLKISCIGYVTQEITVEGNTHLKVIMKDDSQTLDEVVVVGYGVMRKSDLTGAVSSVKATEALKQMPTSDISTALQGRMAGVSIVESSGQPGSKATIRVRGVNSLKSDGGPLVVIDGFTGGDLGSLNPADVESIEVLKDASATAVYGSRGANGVVLVTTKNPEKGKLNVTYNGYANFKTHYKLPDVLSPGDFARLANDYGQEFFTAKGEAAKVYYDADQIAAFDRGEGGYDYLGNIFRDVAFQQVHELSISGGSDKAKYLFSTRYNEDEGSVRTSKRKQVTYRLKLDADIRKWLRAGVNFWGNYNTSQGPRFSQYRGVLLEALSFPTTIAPKNEDGIYNNANLIGPQYNPMGHLWEMDKGGYSYASYYQGYVDITLLKGLTFRMMQGFILDQRVEYDTTNEKSYEYFVNPSTGASAKSTWAYQWANTNMLSYVRDFSAAHRINATLVMEQIYDNKYWHSSGAKQLTSTIIGSNNLGLSQTNSAGSERNISTMLSYMFRANYVLLNRYMLTASMRYDGSSKLAKGNHWESFPSMSVAWDIKQEAFLKNNSTFDRLKLRFSYGETGGQGIPNYSAYSTYENKRDAFNELTLQPKSLGNSLLGWERTKQYNLGLDMGFINNRLTVELEVYKKLSEDVMLDIDAPAYTAFPSVLRNAAEIENKGIEVTLSADPIIGKNFNWNTKLTLSHNSAVVNKLVSGKSWMTLSGGYEKDFYRVIEGEKLSSIWGYVSDGIWKTSELGNAPKGTQAGSYRYKNLDDNPAITPDDASLIGNGQPAFNWGWSNTLNYKDFDFSFFVVGFHGFDIYNYTKATLSSGLVPSPNLYDRWTPENENGTLAGFVPDVNGRSPSTQFIEKGDFIKVKSITLGYKLPMNIQKNWGINNLRIYASIQNPFLITSYSGIDPEVTLQNPLTSGVDYGYYPNGRNFIIGLNLGF